MSMPKAAIESLIDLVENRLSTIEIADRDDVREVMNLRMALKFLGGVLAGDGATTMSAEPVRRRGRRPKLLVAMH